MAVSSYDSICAIGTTKIHVGTVNATLAAFFAPIAGQNCWQLKYSSGGTLEMVGCPPGTTLTGDQLLAAIGQHYIFSANEVLSIDGAAPFYLMATGATVVLYAIRGRNAPKVDGTY